MVYFMFVLPQWKRPEQVERSLGEVRLSQSLLGLGSPPCQVTSGMVLTVFGLSLDVGVE